MYGQETKKDKKTLFLSYVKQFFNFFKNYFPIYTKSYNRHNHFKHYTNLAWAACGVSKAFNFFFLSQPINRTTF